MSITRTRRFVLPAVAAIALLLATSPAGAAPSIWDFGGWLRGVLSTIWSDSGCAWDPSGKCSSAPAPVESGCGIDPNGKCGAAPAPVDSGCAADPNGGCKQ